MKIIRRKDVIKAEIQIADCLYIVENTDMDIESKDKLIDNLIDIAANFGLMGLYETKFFLEQLRNRCGHE